MTRGRDAEKQHPGTFYTIAGEERVDVSEADSDVSLRMRRLRSSHLDCGRHTRRKQLL